MGKLVTPEEYLRRRVRAADDQVAVETADDEAVLQQFLDKTRAEVRAAFNTGPHF